jgi:hypothetical protein
LRMVNVNAGLSDRSVDDDRPSSAIQNASKALIFLFRELYWLCEIGFVTNLVSIYLNHEKLNFYEKISLQNHMSFGSTTSGLHDTHQNHPEFKSTINVGVSEHNKSKILSLAHLRLEALKLLAEHEAWIPLNFPNFGDTDLRYLKLTKRFCDRHYLVSELLRLVQYSLTTGVNENLQFRTECLQAFRDILIKTTLDDRYKTDLEQSRISLLFSPFVGFVTRNFHQLNFNMLADISACKRRDSIRTTLQTDKTDPDIESLKILLKCYLHLLNHLPLDTLKEFWQQCQKREVESFFSILQVAIQLFRFVEKKEKPKPGQLPFIADRNLRVSLIRHLNLN